MRSPSCGAGDRLIAHAGRTRGSRWRHCFTTCQCQPTLACRFRRQLREADGCVPVDLRYRVGVVLQRRRAAAGMAEPRDSVPEVEAFGEHLAVYCLLVLMSRWTPAALARSPCGRDVFHWRAALPGDAQVQELPVYAASCPQRHRDQLRRRWRRRASRSAQPRDRSRVLGAGDRATVGVQDLAGDVGPGVFTGATPCLT
jgi:hypothetical protein